MNSVVKEKWVKALRGGEYKQGQKRLRRDDTFCCLGVLCDLYIKEKGLEWNLRDKDYDVHGETATLPLEVADWAEVESPTPYVQLNDFGTISLIFLNDRSMFSFDQIASLIEKQL